MNTALTSARTYAAAGWCVTPTRGKRPFLESWQTRRLADPELSLLFTGDANVGVVLGAASGMLVDIDLDAPTALAVSDLLPPTLRIFGRRSKPCSHWLYRTDAECYAKYTDPTKRPNEKDAVLLELRADSGHQTIFPGSVHDSGEPITWERDLGEPTLLPLADLQPAIERVAAAALLARYWPGQGLRDEAGLHLSGWLAHNGWSEDDIDAFVQTVARAAGDEEWEDRGKGQRCVERIGSSATVTGRPSLEAVIDKQVIAQAADWLRLKERHLHVLRDGAPGGAGYVPAGASFALTDYGNAERLVARHGLNLRYCYAWKKWLIWNGQAWQVDTSGEVTRLAKETVRAIYREAADAVDDQTRAALAKHALKSEGKKELAAMIELAQSEPAIPVQPGDLDAHPFLITCQNGTLDLITKRLHESRREDLLTKLVPVPYLPEADCPRWRQFIESIMATDAALVRFLHRAIGYALTGDTREQCLFLLYGKGRNGKSTFLEVLQAMLGPFAQAAPTELLMMQDRAGIPNDVARLMGARLVTAVETEEGQRLAESKVKRLTGSERVPARFLHAEWFEFLPEFKLFLAMNHKPVIRGTDDGIWRRIRLIPFTQQFEGVRDDKGLKQKLMGELAGIFAWAVAGCEQWQLFGLGMPEAVAEATGEYREEQDVLAAFLRDTCYEGKAAKVPAADLYAAYTAWCKEGNEYTLNQRRFGLALTEQRGYKREKHGHSNRWHWFGVGLLADRGPDDDDQETPVEDTQEGYANPFNGFAENGFAAMGSQASSLDTSTPVESANPCDPIKHKNSLACAGEEKPVFMGSHGFALPVASDGERAEGREPIENDGFAMGSHGFAMGSQEVSVSPYQGCEWFRDASVPAYLQALRWACLGKEDRVKAWSVPALIAAFDQNSQVGSLEWNGYVVLPRGFAADLRRAYISKKRTDLSRFARAVGVEFSLIL